MSCRKTSAIHIAHIRNRSNSPTLERQGRRQVGRRRTNKPCSTPSWRARRYRERSSCVGSRELLVPDTSCGRPGTRRVAARRGSATNTPGRVLSGTFESPALALVIADRLVGESMTLGVAHAVGRESCGHHVACRVGGRDRTECSRVGHEGASVSKVRPVAAAACDVVPLFV